MNDGTKARAKAARERRLQAALRENLKRRKTQARSRTEAEAEPREAEPARSAASSDQDKT
jgi:hypothetical protein